jgi:dihydrofolate synthase/folylpolyglutamate synthase
MSLGLQALHTAEFVLDESLCRQALNNIHLIGRCHIADYKGNRVVLDVAHNPAAAKVLADFLKPAEGSSTFAVASALLDKDWHNIVTNMSEVVDYWFVGQITDNPRAMDARSLLEVVYNADQNGESCASIEVAFDEAITRCDKGDTIVVLGSFSVVSAVLAVMGKEV